MITVVTPAATQALTTLAAIKAELAVTGGSDDAYLSAAIARASAAVCGYCNRVLAAETLSAAS